MLVRRADVLWRSAPGFLVVATVDGEVTSADGQAVAVWELLATPVSFDELAATLARRHGLHEEQIRSDITPFLRQMIDVDLVAVGTVDA